MRGSSVSQGKAAEGERRHVLVVDDDPDLRRVIRDALEAYGYPTLGADGGDAMRAALAEKDVGLVLLEISLKLESGLDLASELRANYALPFIIASVRTDPVDRAIGLEIGADDYISKPFHLRELIARVNAVTRRFERTSHGSLPHRSASNHSECLGFGSFVLDTAKHQLSGVGGAVVELTTAEYNLLDLFVRRPNRVLTRNEIMDKLKGQDWSSTDRSIDVLVAKLRKKLGDDDRHPEIVRTIRGAGYMLVAAVNRK